MAHFFTLYRKEHQIAFFQLGAFNFFNLLQHALRVAANGFPAGDEIFIYLGEFTVGDKTQLSLKVELYDVNGRLVNEIAPRLDDWTIKMDINNLPVGVYSVRVVGQQLNKTFKFIKQ